MALPFATTTVSIVRSSADYTADGYSDTLPVWTVAATGIRAHISRPSFSETRAGSIQDVNVYSIALDPCGLLYTDHVKDEGDQTVYEVMGLQNRNAFGLNHVTAQVRLAEGYVG